MVTQEQEEEPAQGSGRRPALASAALSVVAVAVPILIVGSVFLWPFLMGRSTTPFGFDTPHYIWRSNLVASQGLDALGSMPINLNANAERPAYPVYASLNASIGGVEPARLAYVVPAVFAIAIGLAAGAFALEVLEEPPWSFPIYAILVGTSLAVVGTAVGSLDNLMVDSVLLAGATAAFVSSGRRRGAVGAVLVLAAAVMIHWIFALLLLALLAGTALFLLPDAIGRRRRGEETMATPAARLASIAAAAFATGALALQLIPGLAITPPAIPLEKIAAKVRSRPALRFTVSGPLAALGPLTLWRPATSSRRRGLLFLVLWAGSVAAAILLYVAGAHDLPTYRAAEFGLGIPILGAAPLAWVIRVGRDRLGRLGTVAGVAVAMAAIALTISIAAATWEVSPSLMAPDRVRELATAATYLDAVNADVPVIVVVSTPRFTATDRVVRSGMSGNLVAGLRTYFGEGTDLLAGRQTVFPSDSPLGPAAADAWPTVEPLLQQDFIAIYLSSFNPGFPPPAGAVGVAPGVFVLRGPTPPGPIAEAPPPGPAPGALLAAGALALLLLMLAGSGWAAALVSAGWLSRAGLAPGFGLAAITLVGVALARFGAPLHGGFAAAVLLITTVGGWATFAALRIVRPPASDPEDEGPAAP
jgi:hypothetical protein